MRERQVTLPPLGLTGTSWGLGWEIYDWSSGMVLGHDGGTIGQPAFLRVVPDKDVAIAPLTNGGNPVAHYLAIHTHLLRELADVELPPLPKPPPAPEPFDATRYVGTYSCEVADLMVSQDDDGRVWAELAPKGILAEQGGAECDELVRLDGHTLVVREPRHSMRQPHVLLVPVEENLYVIREPQTRTSPKAD